MKFQDETPSQAPIVDAGAMFKRTGWMGVRLPGHPDAPLVGVVRSDVTIRACQTYLLACDQEGRFERDGYLHVRRGYEERPGRDDVYRVRCTDFEPDGQASDPERLIPRVASSVVHAKRTLVLSKPWDTNFFHWLCETSVLYRLAQVLAVDDPDLVLVASQSHQRIEHVETTLRSLSVRPGRSLYDAITWVDEHCEVRCDAAFFHHYQWPDGQPLNSWQRDVVWQLRLEAAGSPPPEPGPAAVFLTRGHTQTRYLVNEQQLASELQERFGVLPMVPEAGGSLLGQIRAMAAVHLLVTAAGSGCINALFLPNGASVVVLVSKDCPPWWIRRWVGIIQTRADLQVSVCQGSRAEQPEAPGASRMPENADWHIDPALVVTAVERTRSRRLL